MTEAIEHIHTYVYVFICVCVCVFNTSAAVLSMSGLNTRASSTD